jgi:hypothetical protein
LCVQAFAIASCLYKLLWLPKAHVEYKTSLQLCTAALA